MNSLNFGTTDLKVSRLGFGAGHIGRPDQSEQEIEYLLQEIVSRGINLIDTARSYGLSEERIGRFLSTNRHEIILSTKVGYTYQDKPDWSYEATMGTIEDALVRLKTDYLDIVHLHSCDLDTLKRGDAIRALQDAVSAGKIRVPAYSGENEALQYAIDCDHFGSIQCSLNLFDQHNLKNLIPQAAQKGLGIIVKRPLGNCVWRYSSRPDGHGHALYYDRFQEMNIDTPGISWNELAVRFTAFSPYIHSMILGSSTLSHLIENIEAFEKGPLETQIRDQIISAYDALGHNLPGLI